MTEPEEAVEIHDQGIGRQKAQKRIDVEIGSNLFVEGRFIGTTDQHSAAAGGMVRRAKIKICGPALFFLKCITNFWYRSKIATMEIRIATSDSISYALINTAKGWNHEN